MAVIMHYTIEQLQDLIATGWENRQSLSPNTDNEPLKQAVTQVIQLLENGQLRVASPSSKEPTGWQVNPWLKQAVLLYFRLHNNQIMQDNNTRYFDKVPLRFDHLTNEEFKFPKSLK